MHESELAQRALENVQQMKSRVVSRGGQLLLKKATAENYIGSGGEKDVFDLGNGRIIAIFPRENLGSKYLAAEIKSYYYAAKIAHIVAPENIPEIFMASSQPPALVSERIEGEETGGEDADYRDRYDLRRKFEQFGLQDALDHSADNFIRLESGELAYVDIVNPYSLINNQEFDDYVETLDPTQSHRIKHLQARLLANLGPLF